MERVPRDRCSLDILSVKKEAKLAASEVNDVQVGRGDADLRQSNLLTIVFYSYLPLKSNVLFPPVRRGKVGNAWNSVT